MGLAKACFSLFRVGIGWYLWSWRRKEPPAAVPPASEATSRGAEHSLLLPLFSCFRLHPAHKKRDPNRSLSFVELEDTDPRFSILLIIFIVQITVSKMVSVFDRCKITTFFSYNPLIYKTLFSVVSLYFPRRW